MSRNTPRRRRSAAAAAPAIDPRSNSAPEPIDEGWNRSLDITRAIFGASLGASKEWMRGLGDWQQAQATAMRHAGESIDEIASQAEHAADWPTLWALQASLAGTQWTRAMQDCTELIEQAMQIESRLVERSRAEAARLSQHWLDGADGGKVRDASDVVEAITPLALLTQAQATMGEMSRLWAQSLYDTTLPD